MPRRRTSLSSPPKRPLDKDFSFETIGKRRKSSASDTSDSGAGGRDAGARSPRLARVSESKTGSGSSSASQESSAKGGIEVGLNNGEQEASADKRQRSLEALFQVTDSELQKVRQEPASSSASEAGEGCGEAAAAGAGEVIVLGIPGEGQHQLLVTGSRLLGNQQVVRLPGSEGGVEKFHVKSDSLEEQGLKLVYTKQVQPASMTVLDALKVKGQKMATAVNLQDKTVLIQAADSNLPTVGRKRKHPPRIGRHICKYCGRGCAKPSVLQKHIRAHTGERPYPCLDCGFSFKTKSNLYKHCKSRAHAQKAGLLGSKDKGEDKEGVEGVGEGEGEGKGGGEDVTGDESEHSTESLMEESEAEDEEKEEKMVESSEERKREEETMLEADGQRIDRHKLLEWGKNLEKQKKQKSDALLQVHSQFPIKIAPKNLGGGASSAELAPLQGLRSISSGSSAAASSIVRSVSLTSALPSKVTESAEVVRSLSRTSSVSSEASEASSMVITLETVKLPRPGSDPAEVRQALQGLEQLSSRFQSAASQGIPISTSVQLLEDRSLQVTIHLPKQAAATPGAGKPGRGSSHPPLQKSMSASAVGSGSKPSSITAATEHRAMTAEMLKERIQNLISENAAIVDMPMAEPPRPKARGLFRQNSDICYQSWRVSDPIVTSTSSSDSAATRITIPSISSVPLQPMVSESESGTLGSDGRSSAETHPPSSTTSSSVSSPASSSVSTATSSAPLTSTSTASVTSSVAAGDREVVEDGVKKRLLQSLIRRESKERSQSLDQQPASQSGENQVLQGVSSATTTAATTIAATTTSAASAAAKVVPASTPGQEIKIQIKLTNTQGETTPITTLPMIGQPSVKFPSSPTTAVPARPSLKESSVIKDLLQKGQSSLSLSVEDAAPIASKKSVSFDAGVVGGEEDGECEHVCCACGEAFMQEKTLHIHKMFYCKDSLHPSKESLGDSAGTAATGVEDGVKGMDSSALMEREVLSLFFSRSTPSLMRSHSTTEVEMLRQWEKHGEAYGSTKPSLIFDNFDPNAPRKKGRPKGSKNRPKDLPVFTNIALLTPGTSALTVTGAVLSPLVTTVVPSFAPRLVETSSPRPVLSMDSVHPLSAPFVRASLQASQLSELAVTSAMIGQPMVCVSRQNSMEVGGSAGSTPTPLTPSTPVMTDAKMKLKGKLLMKRSMSVEKLGQQERDSLSPQVQPPQSTLAFPSPLVLKHPLLAVTPSSPSVLDTLTLKSPLQKAKSFHDVPSTPSSSSTTPTTPSSSSATSTTSSSIACTSAVAPMSSASGGALSQRSMETPIAARQPILKEILSSPSMQRPASLSAPGLRDLSVPLPNSRSASFELGVLQPRPRPDRPPLERDSRPLGDPPRSTSPTPLPASSSSSSFLKPPQSESSLSLHSAATVSADQLKLGLAPSSSTVEAVATSSSTSAGAATVTVPVVLAQPFYIPTQLASAVYRSNLALMAGGSSFYLVPPSAVVSSDTFPGASVVRVAVGTPSTPVAPASSALMGSGMSSISSQSSLVSPISRNSPSLAALGRNASEGELPSVSSEQRSKVGGEVFRDPETVGASAEKEGSRGRQGERPGKAADLEPVPMRSASEKSLSLDVCNSQPERLLILERPSLVERRLLPSERAQSMPEIASQSASETRPASSEGKRSSPENSAAASSEVSTVSADVKTPTTEAKGSQLSREQLRFLVPFLLGHNLPSLRGSCHVSFCSLQRSQPSYVVASKKVSMYSSWRIAAHNPNPAGLTAKMLLSLYSSRYTSNPVWAHCNLSQPLGGLATHSSYWSFQRRQQQQQQQSKAPSTSSASLQSVSVSKPLRVEVEEDMEVTYQDSGGKARTSKSSADSQAASTLTSDETSTSEVVTMDTGDGVTMVMRQLSPSAKSLSQESPISQAAVEREKVCQGGFKTNEDYTYVRGRGRGKYVCERCGIRCKKPSMLKKHIRTHTDYRPYHCRHCRFSFKTKGNLTKHMKSKAHQKKCIELGIHPIPMTVDDSQIDAQALAAQCAVAKDARIMDAQDRRVLQAAGISNSPQPLVVELDDDEGEDEDDEEDEEDSDSCRQGSMSGEAPDPDVIVSTPESREASVESSSDAPSGISSTTEGGEASVAGEGRAKERTGVRETIARYAALQEAGSKAKPLSSQSAAVLSPASSAAPQSSERHLDTEIAHSLLDLSTLSAQHPASQQSTTSSQAVTPLDSLIHSLMPRTQSGEATPITIRLLTSAAPQEHSSAEQGEAEGDRTWIETHFARSLKQSQRSGSPSPLQTATKTSSTEALAASLAPGHSNPPLVFSLSGTGPAPLGMPPGVLVQAPTGGITLVNSAMATPSPGAAAPTATSVLPTATLAPPTATLAPLSATLPPPATSVAPPTATLALPLGNQTVSIPGLLSGGKFILPVASVSGVIPLTGSKALSTSTVNLFLRQQMAFMQASQGASSPSSSSTSSPSTSAISSASSSMPTMPILVQTLPAASQPPASVQATSHAVLTNMLASKPAPSSAATAGSFSMALPRAQPSSTGEPLGVLVQQPSGRSTPVAGASSSASLSLPGARPASMSAEQTTAPAIVTPTLHAEKVPLAAQAKDGGALPRLVAEPVVRMQGQDQMQSSVLAFLPAYAVSVGQSKPSENRGPIIGQLIHRDPITLPPCKVSMLPSATSPFLFSHPFSGSADPTAHMAVSQEGMLVQASNSPSSLSKLHKKLHAALTTEASAAGGGSTERVKKDVSADQTSKGSVAAEGAPTQGKGISAAEPGSGLQSASKEGSEAEQRRGAGDEARAKRKAVEGAGARPHKVLTRQASFEIVSEPSLESSDVVSSLERCGWSRLLLSSEELPLFPDTLPRATEAIGRSRSEHLEERRQKSASMEEAVRMAERTTVSFDGVIPMTSTGALPGRGSKGGHSEGRETSGPREKTCDVCHIAYVPNPARGSKRPLGGDLCLKCELLSSPRDSGQKRSRVETNLQPSQQPLFLVTGALSPPRSQIPGAQSSTQAPLTLPVQPYSCSICKAFFRTKGYLDKHLRSKRHVMTLETMGMVPVGTSSKLEKMGRLGSVDASDPSKLVLYLHENPVPPPTPPPSVSQPPPLSLPTPTVTVSKGRSTPPRAEPPEPMDTEGELMIDENAGGDSSDTEADSREKEAGAGDRAASPSQGQFRLREGEDYEKNAQASNERVVVEMKRTLIDLDEIGRGSSDGKRYGGGGDSDSADSEVSPSQALETAVGGSTLPTATHSATALRRKMFVSQERSKSDLSMSFSDVPGPSPASLSVFSPSGRSKSLSLQPSLLASEDRLTPPPSKRSRMEMSKSLEVPDSRGQRSHLKTAAESGDDAAGRGGDRSHTCNICGQGFPSFEELRTHLVNHAELRPFVCEYCDAGFTNERSLQIHRQTHPQERPYICGLCGDTFATADSLKQHQNTHSGLPFTLASLPLTSLPIISLAHSAGQSSVPLSMHRDSRSDGVAGVLSCIPSLSSAQAPSLASSPVPTVVIHAASPTGQESLTLMEGIPDRPVMSIAATPTPAKVVPATPTSALQTEPSARSPLVRQVASTTLHGAAFPPSLLTVQQARLTQQATPAQLATPTPLTTLTQATPTLLTKPTALATPTHLATPMQQATSTQLATPTQLAMTLQQTTPTQLAMPAPTVSSKPYLGVPASSAVPPAVHIQQLAAASGAVPVSDQVLLLQQAGTSMAAATHPQAGQMFATVPIQATNASTVLQALPQQQHRIVNLTPGLVIQDMAGNAVDYSTLLSLMKEQGIRQLGSCLQVPDSAIRRQAPDRDGQHVVEGAVTSKALRPLGVTAVQVSAAPPLQHSASLPSSRAPEGVRSGLVSSSSFSGSSPASRGSPSPLPPSSLTTFTGLRFTSNPSLVIPVMMSGASEAVSMVTSVPSSTVAVSGIQSLVSMATGKGVAGGSLRGEGAMQHQQTASTALAEGRAVSSPSQE